jgi:hypothetical protein
MIGVGVYNSTKGSETQQPHTPTILPPPPKVAWLMHFYRRSSEVPTLKDRTNRRTVLAELYGVVLKASAGVVLPCTSSIRYNFPRAAVIDCLSLLPLHFHCPFVFLRKATPVIELTSKFNSRLQVRFLLVTPGTCSFLDGPYGFHKMHI